MAQPHRQLEIFDLLNVNLPTFEGPLDLLLDLIRKQKMDIQEISLSDICSPYLEYLELMEEFDMEIAIDFLDIASTLVLIKSRTLLPKPEMDEEGDEMMDTEEQLRKKLIEYQRYKMISEYFNNRAILGRDTFTRPEAVFAEEAEEPAVFAELSIYNLLTAYKRSMRKKEYKKPHTISSAEFPIERKIVEFMHIFKSGQMLLFQNLFAHDTKKPEIIISFMAILELAKLFLMKIHQIQEFGAIHCKATADLENHIPKFEAQLKNVS